MEKEEKKYDFSGWATRNDLKCADGRIIRKDAFKHNSGKKVPLVWNHQHNDPNNILGHAILENREEGVYAYGKFNDTENGLQAKTLVKHGDVESLSIYANHLKEQGGNVSHGDICEVSLVLAGANPGAYIESIIMHGEKDDEDKDELALIFTGYAIKTELEHASEAQEDKKDKPVADIFETLNEEQKTMVHTIVGQALSDADDKTEGGEVEHADKGDKTIAEIFDTLNEEQKTMVYALIGQVLDEAGTEGQDDELDHSDNVPDDKKLEHSDNNIIKGGTNRMKVNVFDKEGKKDEKILSHSDVTAILADAKRLGSIKEAVLSHGIGDIDYLFPDATALDTPPSLITRDMSWVSTVMKGVHHTPFSRIKSVFADLTEADARAKGYLKGNLKLEEVFGLLKRTTTPTTIYKKQKLDRDDVVDITDFDVVAWLKSEMRMMLDEEIARAILVGDGRRSHLDDKINELNIRPIWTDAELFTICKLIVPAVPANPGATPTDAIAKAFIHGAIRARKDYKGSGTPTLFTTETMLTNCLLMEDGVGRVIYDTVDKLATVMRVKEIVTVPVMENLTRDNETGDSLALLGIIVNLADYNVGADKGGAINMFDDFDIDFNAQKYLIETRCSGALIKPYSAIALEIAAESVIDLEEP